ncbi:MAG TPA: hypothetical protein VNF68_15655, partial [Candidatus Baltobacteraceae bacterium]|nr:hypothetical protein [Candidatus Baltobacteraceae bacterium]
MNAQLSLLPALSLLDVRYDLKPCDVESITETLAKFPLHILELLSAKGTRVVPLGKGVKYRDASPALKRMGIDVDNWACPPAGLFVVEERSVYARSCSAMTIAHETGHAIDCALGDGVYWSGFTPEVRAA